VQAGAYQRQDPRQTQGWPVNNPEICNRARRAPHQIAGDVAVVQARLLPGLDARRRQPEAAEALPLHPVRLRCDGIQVPFGAHSRRQGGAAGAELVPLGAFSWRVGWVGWVCVEVG